MKLNITRRDKIGICLAILYALLGVFVGGCLDSSGNIFAKTNPIHGFGLALGFKDLEANGGSWIMLLFILIYIPVCGFLESCIESWFRKSGKNVNSAQAWGWYVGSGALCLLVALGLGTLFQIPFGFTVESYTDVIVYLYQTLLMALIIFAVLYLLVFAVVGIVFSLRKTELQKKLEDKAEDEALIADEKADAEKGAEADLSSAFDDVDSVVDKAMSGSAVRVAAAAPVASAPVAAQSALGIVGIGAKEEVFPGLVGLDKKYSSYSSTDLTADSKTDLKSFVSDLQVYLAKNFRLYYSLPELAFFTAALSATKLVILEGISGTGKSSLPRYFARFIGEEAFFEPIQVTYKEKSDLLGYLNEFTGKYHETQFLKRIYEAGYRQEFLNLMVLDEMNISRVEYYFADFLSVLEFPEDDRRISLAQLPADYDGPAQLKDGFLRLTPNTVFVGTCNKDDSTFTVTDKVIDRALVLDFERYQGRIDVDRDVSPLTLSWTGLNELFRQAQENPEYRFSDEDRSRLVDLLSFMYSEFSVAVGNRVLVQLDRLIPVYIAMGRDRNEALDEVFATKILRKLSGRFDSSLKPSLAKLEEELDRLYGKESFPVSRRAIAALTRRL